MYIVTCVYNTLSQWARRMKREKMSTIYIQVAMGALAIGFSTLALGVVTNYPFVQYLSAGIIFVGFIFWSASYSEYKKERRRERNRENRLLDSIDDVISELKGIRNDIKGLKDNLDTTKNDGENTVQK